MDFRAKNDFKLQIKVGEFIHFKTGDLIPPKFMNSPHLRDFLMDHSVFGESPKTQVIVQKPHPSDHPKAPAAVMPKADDLNKFSQLTPQEQELKHTVEPTSRLTQPPPPPESFKSTAPEPKHIPKTHRAKK